MAAIEGKRTTVEEYLRDIENYSSFINHLGGVCDMMGHMDEALKARDAIHDPVMEFHHLRSNAIHASRIPMQQDYADLRIPIICRTKDPPVAREDDVGQSRSDDQLRLLVGICEGDARRIVQGAQPGVSRNPQACGSALQASASCAAGVLAAAVLAASGAGFFVHSAAVRVPRIETPVVGSASPSWQWALSFTRDESSLIPI